MKSYLLQTWQAVKHRDAYLKLGQPLITERAQGSFVWDERGKKYTDFLMGWGANLFGYQDERIEGVIRENLSQKDVFNNHSMIEYELSEKLFEWYPEPMRIAYFLNGSDATTMAVRIARASTRRNKVISCGYHGWHDWAQPTSSGVLPLEKENSLSFKYKNFDDLVKVLEKEKSEVAALVLETPFPNHQNSDIKELCSYATKHNILIIFDEVKAGGRLGYTYGYDVLQIIPDLTVYGKAFGGGLPLSMLLVKEDRVATIPNDIHCSATFWGYSLALHVASDIIDRVNNSDEITNLHERSKRFISRNNDLFEKIEVPIRFTGNPVMPFLEVGDKITDQFYSSCFEGGLYIRPKHCLFLSTAHSEAVLDETTDTLESIVSNLT